MRTKSAPGRRGSGTRQSFTGESIPFVLALVISAIFIADPIEAQSGSLIGRVLSDSSSLPIKGAEIALTAVDRFARTDSLGAFRITGLRAGRYPVLIRMLGFSAIADTVWISDGAEHSKEYRLATRMIALDSVRVTALGRELVSPRMRTFERRRAGGFGTFIGDRVLRENEQVTLRYVLARIPGLRFVTYQNATFAALARSSATMNPPRAIPWDNNSPRRCWVQIYLDAIRIYNPVTSARGSPDAGQQVPNIEDFRVRDLGAIEFYSGPAATPAELGGTGATCGTLVLWTR
ncbi:MAG TPA: carboxypeptidase-like regulatory domain-containing protein [Gemmatimonadaceae bacterium]